MISLTNHANEKLQDFLTDGRNLRVLVKTTGCSGMAYHLEYAIYKNITDIEQKFDGFSVLIDPKSFKYVDGCEIDLSLIHI